MEKVSNDLIEKDYKWRANVNRLSKCQLISDSRIVTERPFGGAAFFDKIIQLSEIARRHDQRTACLIKCYPRFRVRFGVTRSVIDASEIGKKTVGK